MDDEGEEDIKKFADQIEGLLNQIEERKPNFKNRITPDFLEKIKRLREVIILFQKFNEQEFLRAGATPAELAETIMSSVRNREKADREERKSELVKKLEILRGKAVLLESKIIQESIAELEKNSPLMRGLPGQKLVKGKKGSVKKRFKEMKNKMKWKKL